MTEDLRAIQEELDWASTRETTRAENGKLLDELLNTEIVIELKAALDHLRGFLWSYIQAASGKSGSDVNDALQSLRMQRATEMLRVLRHKFEQANLAESPEARGLFEEIHLMANSMMDRHFESLAQSAMPSAGPALPAKPRFPSRPTLA